MMRNDNDDTLREPQRPSDWAMAKWSEAMERGDSAAARNYQIMYENWKRIEAQGSN